ncbi:MAG TPA: DUF885 family protein, partial [Bryobacteraceae bacterium]|nr:DUF885 family protein [Bryobacteraceae bacterium]
MRKTALLFLCLATISCSRKTPASDFPKVAEEAVYKILSFSPVTASGQGLHQYQGQDFDRELDNLSFRAIQKEREYYAELHKRLEQFDKESLSPEDRADYDVIEYQIGLGLFDIDIARSWQRSPQSYVELLGTALFNPLVLEYAPKEQRFQHIISRIEKIPGFLDVARRQLSN